MTQEHVSPSFIVLDVQPELIVSYIYSYNEENDEAKVDRVHFRKKHSE